MMNKLFNLALAALGVSASPPSTSSGQNGIKVDKLAEILEQAHLLPLSEWKRNYFVKFYTYENEY